MTSYKYSSEKHQGYIEEWLQLRGLPVTDAINVPINGLIIFNNEEPITIGFIRLCEGNIGILDSYISNPQQSGLIRDEALNLLTSSLIDLSKELKLIRLIAISKDLNTIVRAQRYGFTYCDELTLVLN